MEKTVTLSTIISSDIKRAAVSFCKRKGLKLRYFIEEALIDQLEDEIDIETFRRRRNEEIIPLEQVLSKRSKN